MAFAPVGILTPERDTFTGSARGLQKECENDMSTIPGSDIRTPAANNRRRAPSC